MTTLSFHTRINDLNLSFGMVRFSAGDKPDAEYFWKMVLSESCGINRLTSMEVTIQDLQKIKSFCDQAIETLETDGGRI